MAFFSQKCSPQINLLCQLVFMNWEMCFPVPAGPLPRDLTWPNLWASGSSTTKQEAWTRWFQRSIIALMFCKSINDHLTDTLNMAGEFCLQVFAHAFPPPDMPLLSGYLSPSLNSSPSGYLSPPAMPPLSDLLSFLLLSKPQTDFNRLDWKPKSENRKHCWEYTQKTNWRQNS